MQPIDDGELIDAHFDEIIRRTKLCLVVPHVSTEKIRDIYNYVMFFNPKPNMFSKTNANENQFTGSSCLFFFYNRFEDAILVKNSLNGTNVPNTSFTLNLRFRNQDKINEYLMFFSIGFPWITASDVERIFGKYRSFIGCRKHYVENRRSYSRTCAELRFLDYNDCIQAYYDFNGRTIDSTWCTIGFFTKCLSNVQAAVICRETKRAAEGFPEFRTFYKKRKIDIEEANKIAIEAANDFNSMLEDSRWTPVSIDHNVTENEMRQMICLDQLQNI